MITVVTTNIKRNKISLVIAGSLLSLGTTNIEFVEEAQVVINTQWIFRC